MLNDRNKVLEGLQFTGLMIMLVGLSVSNFLMSLATIWLSGVFLLHLINDYFSGRKIGERLSRFTSSRYAVLFISVYCFLLIGMLWSSDWHYGLKDLKTKLPLLVMPIVITTLNPVGPGTIRSLLILFISTLVVATLVCLSVYWGMFNSFANLMHWKLREVRDIRDISIFISHIRFSLLLVVGICILLTRFFKRPVERTISVAVLLFFIYFLWVVESITGFAILSVLLFMFFLHRFFALGNLRMKAVSISVVLLFMVVFGIFCFQSYREYYAVEPVDIEHLDEFTQHGERYEHHPESSQFENGHYVMIYIAWGEMAEAWRTRSAVDFESYDASGNLLKGTLLRYLSSKGLRKDREGVMALNDEDIRQIEDGVPNVTWQHKNGLQLRVERILFEYNNYVSGGNPSGHSVFQRFEFWKAGWGIVKTHPLFGVGTGDVPRSFDAQYEKMNTPLDRTHWLRAHNQYLTVWISIGIIGLTWFLFVLFYPLTRKEYRTNALYLCFWITATLSFFTEDTLESQAGVSFYVFLTCFLIFLPRKEVVDPSPVQG